MVIMFKGFEKHTVEEKGRLVVSAKFRKGIKDGVVVVTRGYEGCLAIYPLEEWHSFEKKLLKLSVTDRRARRIIRWFTNNAEALKLDSQGRINIPDYLLEFAGIRKQVVIAGALNHLEVWSVENYERQNLDSDPSHIEGMEAIL